MVEIKEFHRNYRREILDNFPRGFKTLVFFESMLYSLAVVVVIQGVQGNCLFLEWNFLRFVTLLALHFFCWMLLNGSTVGIIH